MVEKGESSEKKEENELLLQIIKQSEYDVIEQLKKTPARISLLSLIVSLKVHRHALLRVLDQAFVTPDITLGQFEKISSIQFHHFLKR